MLKELNQDRPDEAVVDLPPWKRTPAKQLPGGRSHAPAQTLHGELRGRGGVRPKEDPAAGQLLTVEPSDAPHQWLRPAIIFKD